MKHSFTDSIHMECLTSVLDGEPKKCINAFGTNGMFYASALKSLKKQFSNPYLVSYYKLQILFDLPPLSRNDIGLRCYHQQLKVTLTWFQSMGYTCAIKSIENITKAITCLPKPLRTKFYHEMKTTSYNKNNITLLVLERWLETKIQETFNPLASIIKNEIKGKQTKTPTTQQHAFATSSLSNGGNTQNIAKCWLCSEDHKNSDCDTLKKAPVELRIDIVKLNKLCFNCLSNSYFINSCKSTNTCHRQTQTCFDTV